MRSKNLALIGGYVVLAALTGCASRPPEETARIEHIANRPLFCAGEEDCQVKWSRALQWVKNNAAYKFDQATDLLISTKGPLPNDPRPAYTITKIGQGGGRYQIDFDGGCDNFIGCIPSLLDAKASFVSFVMGPETNNGPEPGSPVFGIKAVELSAEVAKELGLIGPQGLIVSSVDAGGVAERAGVQVRDVVLTFDGSPVNSTADLRAVLKGTKAGSTVAIRVWRQKQIVSLSAIF